MKRKQRFSCPKCSYYFSWSERFGFAKFGIVRRSVACPRCKAALAWNTWPWRIINIGSVAVLIFLGARWLGYDEAINAHPIALIPFYALLSAMVVAAHKLKFVSASTNTLKHNEGEQGVPGYRRQGAPQPEP